MAQDLRDVLKDAHAHFYILKGSEVERLRMWDILPDSVILDVPTNAPLRRTILGYIPTLKGSAIYEVEGTISNEPVPDQMDNTIRVIVNPENARRVNRRLFPRYSFTPPLVASIIPVGSKKGIIGTIINLSAGGLRVEVPEQLLPESFYTFEFDVNLDDETHAFSLPGSIVYEIPVDTGYAYGVRFAGRDESAKSGGEIPVKALDRTVDLLNLINKLMVMGEDD